MTIMARGVFSYPIKFTASETEPNSWICKRNRASPTAMAMVPGLRSTLQMDIYSFPTISTIPWVQQKMSPMTVNNTAL